MSPPPKGPARLQAQAGVLTSRMGACFPGSHAIFRGHDLHTELQDMGWIELHLFSITGRRFPAAQRQLLEAIWTCTSYPDVRIWNNRVAGLAGSSRSTGTLGLAAAMAVSEAAIYGRGIEIRATDFLIRTQKAFNAGGSLEACILAEMALHRSIAGYGRPVTNGDERIPHILALAAQLGLDQGPHLRLAFAIDDYLRASRWRKSINYGAVVTGLAADIGLSPREFYLFMFPTFLAGMTPCYLEAAERPEGALYAAPCSDIAYAGPAPRRWQPARDDQGQDGE
ncbi:MAG: citryl-CoA lyase [Pseudomonadota bacterium]